MNRLWGRKLAVALLSVGGSAGLAAMAAAAADAPEAPESNREMVVVYDAGDGDRLEIDDLDELEIGDSRTYHTNSGKPVTVTRDEKGYELELDGKKLKIGGLLDDGFGHHDVLFGGHPGERMKMRRIELDGDGGAKGFVISDDPEQEVTILEGGKGEHGLMFNRVAAPPPAFVIDGLLARLEKSEKFRSLDDATQDLVREAIRESAPDAEWIGFPGTGDGAVKVIVRERGTKEGKAERR
jgi:hypothetical protein